ncbi:MAG: hypothetical protein RQ838_03225 [Caldivirga sp.]|nr:hypothetical protein [Caldivirga sp.]
MSSRPAKRTQGSESDISIDEIPESPVVLSSELPDEIVGTVINAEYTTDRFGRQIIKFRVRLSDGRQTVLTYPPSMFAAFKSQAKKLGINLLSEFVDRTFKFKRMNLLSNTRFNARPRHFPVEEVTNEQQPQVKQPAKPQVKPQTKPQAKPRSQQPEEDNEDYGEDYEEIEEYKGEEEQ